MVGNSANQTGRLLPWINGKNWPSVEFVESVEAFEGAGVTQVGQTDADALEAALSSADHASKVMAKMPVHERARLLRKLADLIERDADELAEGITRATGKAIKNASRETKRAPWTVRLSASAGENLVVSNIAPDLIPGGEGVVSIASRRPYGVVAAVTPFNAPLNLVAHKVAPALAAGNSVVVKPSPYEPGSAIRLAQLCTEAGFPDGAVNVIPGTVEMGQKFLADPRVALITFTGGTRAGRAIHAAAGLRPVLLELGGNSANIVHNDADVDLAVAECLVGGFSNNGQSCNSVQRIIVHEDIFENFREKILIAVSNLKVGNPLDQATDVGPLISEAAAIKLVENIDAAKAHGAVVHTGGIRHGAVLEPTVITGVNGNEPLYLDEAFAPIVMIEKYSSLDEAFVRANSTDFALQVAIFTNSMAVGLKAFNEMRAGSVIVNRSSNFRLDQLPYGGVGDSGIGREGPAYVVEAMTYIKNLVIGAQK
jgi:acyl-CoA reductase-like NAD-dependent aldehyde dehydrogenase